MKGKPKKAPRQKDLTDRYMDGSLDEDRIDPKQRFSSKSKNLQRDKTLRTAQMRAEEHSGDVDVESLPIGQVTQVFSLYYEVKHESGTWLCVVRKTLSQTGRGEVVVGDRVRFHDLAAKDESGQPEAVIEQILPRETILTRADSFKQQQSHPIVANAQQMLIVASLREPKLKWGLIDRMIVAAKAGGLTPIICLNKIDLLETDTPKHAEEANQALSHYASLEIPTLRTSVIQGKGIEELKNALKDRITVVAGHSGVGKSSLINTIDPNLDLRTGAISGYTGKGRHTTSSARSYPLQFGGQIIDTPGVKLFGLWDVRSDTLIEFFPDVAAGTAPEWRQESFERIAASLE